MVVYHLQKFFGKSGWNWSKWNTTFWVRFPTENSREQRNIWKGSPIFPDGIFQTEIRVPFLQSHLFFDTSFRPSFFGKLNWFVPMLNAIPGRNLLVLNFANHLPKPWSDRFDHVNGKQPVFVQRGLSRTSVTFIVFIAYLRPGRCLKHWIMPM